MARPFTRRQARENQRFLDALRRTGNSRLAARLLGVHRSTYTKRRAKCPLFAARWDAVLVFAHAALNETRGAQAAAPSLPSRPREGLGEGPSQPKLAPLRTKGGEPHIVRSHAGRLQLRRAIPGRLTKAAEQAFLRALSACGNVRLAAAAAGFSHSTFYTLARKSPAFAREMRLAKRMGYDQVEEAVLMAGQPESHDDDAWRHNDPPPVPRLTAGQAIQLLYLHEKSVRQSWDQPHRRRRRNESEEAYIERLRAMWTAEKAREAEEQAVRRASSEAPDDDWNLDDAPILPDLEQVLGWSNAMRETKPHNPDLALFGGWRLKDWENRRKARKG